MMQLEDALVEQLEDALVEQLELGTSEAALRAFRDAA